MLLVPDSLQPFYKRFVQGNRVHHGVTGVRDDLCVGLEPGDQGPCRIHRSSRFCDEYGMDTTSCSGAIGFAMECFEKGLVTGENTGGIDGRLTRSRA